MIFELARLSVDPAKAADFEAAVARAAPFFQTAEGCHGMALERIIETPGDYLLRVTWASIEHHMVAFRNSDNFQQWRALAGPFFLTPPQVTHSETISYF
jgi:quinol monooxygenase YgiN